MNSPSYQPTSLTSDRLKTRVLISYWFGEHTVPLGAAVAGGFTELGYEVRCFNTWIESKRYRFVLKPATKIARTFGFKSVDFARNSPFGREKYWQQRFHQTAIDFNPDIILVIQGHQVDPESLLDLKKRNPSLITLGWWVENPRDDNLALISQVGLYDHYFCIHRYNYDHGLGIKYLQAVAVDRVRYHRSSPPLLRDVEIVFVGSWYPKREEFLAEIADLPLSIYGPIWEKKCKNLALLKKLKKRNIWGRELVDIYNRSQIVINISIWDSERQTLNLRTLDVPATGALLLTDDSMPLRELLTPGVDVAIFRTPEELRNQILFYLDNQDARERVAEAGYKRTLALGSYVDKVTDMLMMAKLGNELGARDAGK